MLASTSLHFPRNLSKRLILCTNFRKSTAVLTIAASHTCSMRMERDKLNAETQPSREGNSLNFDIKSTVIGRTTEASRILSNHQMRPKMIVESRKSAGRSRAIEFTCKHWAARKNLPWSLWKAYSYFTTFWNILNIWLERRINKANDYTIFITWYGAEVVKNVKDWCCKILRKLVVVMIIISRSWKRLHYAPG